MSEILEGVLEAVSKQGTGLKVGENWYNIQNKDQQTPSGGLNRGDTVKFKWAVGQDSRGRTGNQVVSKVLVTKKGEPKSKGDYKGGYSKVDQASIERQNSLAHATAIVLANSSGNPSKDAIEVVRIASEIICPFIQQSQAKAAPAPTPATFEDLDESLEGGDFEDLESEPPF